MKRGRKGTGLKYDRMNVVGGGDRRRRVNTEVGLGSQRKLNLFRSPLLYLSITPSFRPSSQSGPLPRLVFHFSRENTVAEFVEHDGTRLIISSLSRQSQKSIVKSRSRRCC